MNIVFEKLPRPESLSMDEVWSPTIPVFDAGLGNAGIDLHSATRVVSSEVGVPPGLTVVDYDAVNTSHTITTTTKSKTLKLYQAIIRTGLRMLLPDGYHMRISSRSGLGFKKNIIAFPGTIDNSYRGEIVIKLSQLTDEEDPFIIEVGDRVAQGIVFSIPNLSVSEGNVSTDTSRGDRGFGSTGR